MYIGKLDLWDLGNPDSLRSMITMIKIIQLVLKNLFKRYTYTKTQ